MKVTCHLTRHRRLIDRWGERRDRRCDLRG